MTIWQRLRRSWSSHGERWLLGLAAMLLSMCLFDPGVTITRARFDHVVVLDVTQSMNVADAQIDGQPVSRLALAKRALHESLLQLPCGSKVGWAIFTEYRALLLLAPIEVCANLKELRATLAQIDGRMAWAGGSEIAKGVHSAIGIARQLPDRPTLVFVTDGHEAPPLNPRYRPAFDDKPGEVGGLIVGVGDGAPSPIPKVDPQGRPLGFWRADEVLQTDPRSQGRGASVKGEMLADDRVDAAAPTLGATPGNEHLSSLRETYLRLLASERGLAYLHLQETAAMAVALKTPAFAKPVPNRADARPALGALAMLLLLARLAGPLWRRLRSPWRTRRTASSSAANPQ